MKKKSSSYLPHRGDICYLDLQPQKGKEQAKRRPVLVISDGRFNKAIGLALVCPITSTPPRHGFHLKLPKNLITCGSIMTEQVKSLDFSARNAAFIEKASDSILVRASEIVRKIIAVED